MNTQNTQNLQNCVQSEVLYLCDSSVDRLLGSVINAINNVRNFYAKQTLARVFTKMSPRLLRDIGLDDPQVQMRKFDSNFYVHASAFGIDPVRNLFR
jgi:hypothetical protein